MKKKTTYADRFKNLREGKNLSQQEFGESLNLSRETVSIIENGHQEPSTKTKRLLKEIYNYDIVTDSVIEGKGKLNFDNIDIEKYLGDITERLIRIEAHVEVYESAIAGLQSVTKSDFMEKVGGLRAAVKEVADRRFSEFARKYA